MGHGKFGAQVTMDNAPLLADDTSFSPQRVRMTDITGTGAADLIYLPPEGGVQVYYNRFGNSWSDVSNLDSFPALDHLSAVDVLDIGARGTQCLCWTSDYLSCGPGLTTMRFLDLTGGNKPGLLMKSSNGIGGQVEINYRSSTQYYMKDRRAGEQWTTRLPFPIHCVERVTTRDVVAQTTYTMRYAYHNGYYDPFDRQFRGFQMVEEWDAEDLAGGSSSKRKFQRPPVHTKSWYYIGSEQIDAEYALPRCYHVDQPQQVPLFAAKISAEKRSLVAAEVQDAYRALAGQQRRQEIFSTDGSSKDSFPYLISQQTYEVVMHQGIPQGQRYGIFRINGREELSCHYERDLNEASIRHSLTLKTDQYGNICKQVVVNYGKLASELEHNEDQKRQKETVIAYQDTSYTTPIDPLFAPASDAPDYFQIPLPSEVCHYRVLPGSEWVCNSPDRYSWEALSTWLPGIHEIPIHETPTGSSEVGLAVLLSKSRTLYSKKDLTGPLQIHNFEPFSVEYQSYQLAFSNKLLETILKDGESPLLNMIDLAEELSRSGYIQLFDVDGREDEWWVPSTRMLYKDTIDDDSPNSSLGAARSHFYVPNAVIDQLGNISHQELDEYTLLTVKSIDAAKNTTTLENSYVHLKSTLFTNANGNRTQTAFDPCGRPVGIAVMGKKTEALGDTLDGFLVEPSQELLQRFIADPSGPVAAQLLGNAGRRLVYYDCLQFGPMQKSQKILPSFQAELVRDTHYRDENGKATVSQIAINIVYFDGHGEAIQQVCISDSDKDAKKWRFSGWVIRDNKRQPVKQFQPFTATTHSFRPQEDSSLAPATTLLRDPIDRVVAVLNADHTWTKTRFDAWKQVEYDEGDTVTIDDPTKDEDVGTYFAMLERDSYLPTWYNSEKTSREAASKSRVYQNTPTTSHTDALGRQIVIEFDNGFLADGEFKDKRLMRKDYDLRGNLAQLRDSLNRVVSVIQYDLLGRPLYSINMDSGSRWNLPNCQSSPFLSWTGRGNRQRISYDKLGRVESIKVQPSRSSQEVTVVKNIYGEGRADALQNNLNDELYQCYDQSGLWTSDSFDFHGNCVKLSAKYAIEYKQTLDWSKNTNALEAIEYSTETSFNAIGLIVETRDFSKEKVLRTYDVAGRIKTLKSLADDKKTVTSSVDNVQYSADDKIISVAYGNGSTTLHEYDARTRRLVRTVTNRTKDKATLEDVSYMHDCMKKVIKKKDSAQQTVYFNNQVVAPTQEYSYNALGQLVKATGREQVDLSNGGQKRLRPYDMASVRNSSIPGDGRQVVEYIETYEYDLGGNILKMQHAPRTAKDYSSWTRTYAYEELSSIPPQDKEIAVKSNRLSRTSVGGVTESYQYNDDAGRNGCMTCIPGYSALAWDYNDKMRSFSTQQTSKPGVTPEMTWYVYNARGERVRKVTDRASSNNGNSSGARSKDTRYLPMRDIFTTYQGDGLSVSNQITTTTVGDTSLSATPIAMLELNANTKEKVVRYQVSERFELDGNAQVISHDEYSPYGASTYHAQIKGIPRKYRFMSYQKDKESGLYICGARYYAPWLGRWTSPDPMGTADGLNLYAYVSNDPINFDDHQGTAGNERQGPGAGNPYRRGSFSGAVNLTTRIPIAETREILKNPTPGPSHASDEHGFNRTISAPSLSQSKSAGPLWVISPGTIHHSISLPRFDIKTDGFTFANKGTMKARKVKFEKESSKYVYDEAHNVHNFSQNIEKARANKEGAEKNVLERPDSIKLLKPLKVATDKYEKVVTETNKAGEPVYKEVMEGSKSFLKLVWEALENPANSKARSKFDVSNHEIPRTSPVYISNVLSYTFLCVYLFANIIAVPPASLS
jgi:RHS repeat-associated protein